MAPTPETMTSEEAAWVRETVWTAQMRKTYRECPGFYSVCFCQAGATYWCSSGRHERCGRGEPLRTYATLICRPGGNRPASFSEPFTHVSDVSATGPRFTSDAMVWLADRVCRWVCPCDCGHAPAEPEQRGPEQLDLFALVS